jgi:hypothetical protein
MLQWIQRVFMQIAVVLDRYPELLRMTNDVNTFIELMKALREGNTRRAAWKAFLLGMAVATYLQLLMDLLDDDDDDDDDNDRTTEIAPDEPPDGGLAEPVPVRYLRELLEQDHRVHESSLKR